MTENDIESRAQRAVELFKQGYNCSQAVFASCADIYGIEDEQLALRLSASFGGGMGRMRLVCGAASGMFMLAGLQNGSATPHDNEGKMANYAFVQQLAGEFKDKYGSLICAELLGLAPKEHSAVSIQPSDPGASSQRNGMEKCLDLALRTAGAAGSVAPTRHGLRLEGLSPIPEARTQQYYEKRPCSEMVAEAVRIYLRMLNG